MLEGKAMVKEKDTPLKLQIQAMASTSKVLIFIMFMIASMLYPTSRR